MKHLWKLALCLTMLMGLMIIGWSAPAQAETGTEYTVEFGYKGLEYVLPGDTSVAMSEILSALGLTGEVSAVEISDTSLFSASDETGEWIVTALQPFITTEWMKVEINGVVYEITVTDDNDGITVIQPNGGTVAYTIEDGYDFDTNMNVIEVHLSNTPAEGYRFDHYTVTDANGNVTLQNTWNLDGSIADYYFTNFSGTATVTAVFKLANHTITVTQPATGGTVSADQTAADEGDRVNLSYTEQSGYLFRNFVVTKASGGTVEVTNSSYVEGEYNWGFNMPAEAVTVTAVFAAPHAITVQQPEHGNIQVASSAAEGDVVTIQFSPDAGYNVKSRTVKKQDGTDVQVNFYITWTFTMPDSPVTVSAEMEPATYTINWETTHCTVSGPESGRFGDTITFTVTPVDGYRVRTINVNNNVGDSLQYGIRRTAVSGNVYTYQMQLGAALSSFDVSVVCDNEANPGFPITKNFNVGGAIITNAAGEQITRAEGGESVTITLTDSGVYNYGYCSFYPTDGHPQKDCIKQLTGHDTVVMPFFDVTVLTTGSAQTFNLAIADNIQHGTVTTNGTNVAYNFSVNLTVAPETGYALWSLTYTPAGSNPVAISKNANGEYTLRMPAADVTVMATFKPIVYSITYETNGGTITTDKNSFTIESEAITLDQPTRTGYGFGGWYDNAELTGSAVTSIPAGSMEDRKFWAKWDGNAYTVHFDANGGSGDAMSDQAFTYGASKALTANTYTPPTGYDFAGWNTVASPTTENPGTAYTNEAEVQNLTAEANGNVILYAQWTQNDYNITIAGTSNGTVTAKVGETENATTAHYNDPVTLTVAPATGYELDTLTVTGVNSNPVTVTNNQFTMPAGNVTVTATFKVIPHAHSFSYSAEGATITAICSADNCPLTNHQATLTIAAPTGDLTYDGTGKAATITDENSIQGSATVSYQKKNGDSWGDTSTAPTDAGTYKASITMGEGNGAATASVEYTIAPKPVTITGLSASEKTYDGTTDATVIGTATIDGLVNNDAVTVTEGRASFDNANVGTGKTVTFTGYSLSGEAAGNYTLSAQPADTTANITARAITITATEQSVEVGGSIAAGTNKVSVTIGSLVDGHSISEVTLTGDTSTVTDNGTITPSAAIIKDASDNNVTNNYSISYTAGTLTVTNVQVYISGVTASNKTYDGGTSATVTGTAGLKKVSDDSEVSSLSITGNITASFADKNVGTGKAVTITAAPLSDATNYSLNIDKSNEKLALTADITEKSVTVTDITATNRDYAAGNTTVELTGGKVNDVESGDTVTVDLTHATGTIESANAGKNKSVTVSGVSLSGEDAGNYTLLAQPTGVTVTINKINYTGTTIASTHVWSDQATTNATLVLPDLPEGASYAANGTVGGQAPDLIDGTPTVIGTTLTYSTTSQTDETSATITIGVTGAANYENYNVVVTVTAKNKDGAGVTISGGNLTRTYGDEAFTLTGSVTSAGTNDAWKWESSDDTVAAVTNGTTATPTITILKASTTPVTLTASYESDTTIGSATITLTVNPKSVTIAGLSVSNKEYDGTTDATVTGTATIEGKVGSDDVDISAGSAKFADKNVGTGKTVTFSGYSLSGSNASNYMLSAQPASVTATITAKSVNITGLSVSGKEYDGTTTAVVTGTATIEGKVGEDDVSVSAGSAAFADANIGTGKTVTFSGYSLAGDDAGNYMISAQPASVTVNITQKAVTVTAEQQTIDFGGSIRTETGYATLTGALSGHRLDAVTLTPTNNIVSIGIYSITPSAATIVDASGNDVTGNYNITYTEGQLTVNKATAKVTTAPTANNRIYNGQAAALLTGGATDTSLEYSTDGTSFSTAVPQGTNVNSYTVYYRAAADNNHDASEAAQMTVSISKAPLTVTANDKTITYGDAPADDGVSYSGFVNSETEAVLTGTLAYAYSYSQYGNVGDSYTITPSGLTSGNYEISFAAGTLTVGQKEVGLTWNITPLTYTGSAQAPTAEATGLVNNDVISVTVSGRQTDAGTGYTATASALNGTKAGNYKLPEEKTTIFAINRAANPATVTGTASVTRGGNAIDLSANVALNGATGDVSYAIGGEANGCSMSGSVLTSGTNTGSVTVNVTIAEHGNYLALEATPITVTITDKAPQTITAEDVTVTYGDTGRKIEAITSGDGALSFAVKSGDAVTVNETTGELNIVKAGSAVITVTASETSAYVQATKEVTVTINTANAVAATVTANNRTYDGKEKPLVTVTDEATGGTMYYALGENATTAPADNLYTTSIPAKTDAGTYYVWYKAAGKDNYADSLPSCVICRINERETFTVRFDANGGTGTMEPQAFSDGEQFVFPTCTFIAPAGKMFAHWKAGDRSYPENDTITVKSDLTAVAVWTDEKEIKGTRQETLKEVPAELKSLYGTVQQIETALLEKLMINGQTPVRGQTLFIDVELMISRDGGKTWVKATAEDFREGGITVEVDYPEGTNGREYLFAVAHMLTIDMNGRKAGEIEIPEVETTEKGLRFTLNGLSPVAISWQKLDDVAGASLPNTGDGSNPIRYMAMLLIALAGIGMIVRKRK